MQHHQPVPGDPTGRNHVLDSFRGFASLTVVLSHVHTMMHSSKLASAHKLDELIGPTLFYLFNGSAVYFMIISGFMMASNLPHWKQSRKGIAVKSLQRITKILVVYWAALLILIAINMLRKMILGNAWTPNSIISIFAQFFFLTNFLTTPLLYIPPAWYLQADLIIFVLVVALYAMWNRLPDTWRVSLRPRLFLFAIPLLALSLGIEVLGPPTELALAVMRLLLYFCLGFLAYYTQKYKSALISFIALVIALLICNDRFGLDKRFYTNMSIIVAFFFVISGYSHIISSFFNQRWMNKLYKLNFAIFLLHWFILRMGMNTARHLTPNSATGLVIVLCCTFVVLFIAAALFERYIQQPILRWHDKVWASWLSGASHSVSEPVESDHAVSKQLKGDKVMLTNS